LVRGRSNHLLHNVGLHAEAPVPTLFRFLVVLALLAGLGLAIMVALATLVQPDVREITIPIPTGRLPALRR
jgi:hypothetical protein